MMNKYFLSLIVSGSVFLFSYTAERVAAQQIVNSGQGGKDKKST
jgi:hypothetical protein